MSRYLLDTHAFLWQAAGDPRLSHHAAKTILEADNELFLSMASVWELAIKISAGRLRLLLDLSTLIHEQLGKNAIRLLHIDLQHVLALETLPLVHRDPFDRLLVAQAMTEGLVLLSGDEALDGYPVSRQW